MKSLLFIPFTVFSLFAVAQSNTCSFKIDSGLIAHYPFVGNARDTSGNNNHGTITGATLTTDRFGVANRAYSFNGSSDFIQINKGVQLTQNYTVSAWINTHAVSTNWQTVIGKYETNLFGPYWFGLHLDRVNMWISSGFGTNVSFDADAIIPTNKWIHVVWIGRGTTGVIYINGIKNGTRTIPLMTQNNDLVTIGKQVLWSGTDSYCWFNGKLDDIRLYTRALTDCEVADLYNKERPPTTSTKELEGVTFNVFPNPSSDKLSINLANTEGPIRHLKVIDLTGKIFLEKKINAQQTILDISQLPKGLYFLMLELSDGQWGIRKFIKS
jgi:hypothetical protein